MFLARFGVLVNLEVDQTVNTGLIRSPLTCKDAIYVVYDIDRFVFSINGHIGYPQQTVHVRRYFVLKFNSVPEV